MNILEYCTQAEKDIIGQIVDGYLISHQNMKEDCKSIYDFPGLFFFTLFQNYDPQNIDCHTVLSHNNGVLTAQFFVNDSKDADSIFQTINLKKAELISRIVFVENLYKNSLIFLEDEDLEQLPKYEKPDNERQEELAKESLKEFTKPIYSKSFFEFIDKHYWSRVIPSSTLIEYRNNGYLTIEQRRHKKEIFYSRLGIITAILIGIVSPILMTKCSKTTIDDEQYNGIINSIPYIPQYPKEITINQNQVDSIISIINSNNKQLNNK